MSVRDYGYLPLTMLIQVLLSLCKLDVTICDLKIYAGAEKAFQLLPQKITTIKTKCPTMTAV